MRFPYDGAVRARRDHADGGGRFLEDESLAMVLATGVLKIMRATKLKKAAHRTA